MKYKKFHQRYRWAREKTGTRNMKPELLRTKHRRRVQLYTRAVTSP